MGHAEVREQQDEDEEVVERQRALDEVDRDVVDAVLAAVERDDDAGDGQAEHQPAERPAHALGEQLHADDAEHDRDRLVEVAEALDEPLDEDEQRAQAEQREHVARPDDQRVAGDREGGRDRVDGEGEIRRDDRRQAQEDRRDVALAVLAGEPVPGAEAVGDREDLAHAAHDEVAIGVDVLPHALVDPVGEHEQQDAEYVEHGVDLLDERRAAEDRQAAQDERGHDAPEQQPRAVLVGHAEVREQQDEDEEVVERQRALDEVDGDVVDAVLAAVERDDDAGDGEAEHEPAERPAHALGERRLTAAREEVQVEPQQREQHDDQPAEFVELHLVRSARTTRRRRPRRARRRRRAAGRPRTTSTRRRA